MPVYSGKNKIDLCRRLGNDWQELADYLEIPLYHRRQFQQGRECQAIWKWLDEKDRLQELPKALKNIEREDLLSVLEEEKIQPQAPTRQQDWDSDEDFNQFQQKAFPKFLFFLPDRKPQKDELREAIKEEQKHSDKKQRPLLCLMHGNDNEYGNFINCLLGDFLVNDKALSEYFHNGLFEIELLLEEFHTVDKLHQEILDSLVKNKINAKPEKKAIAHELAMKRCPIIIHVRLQSKDLEDWQDDDKTVLDGFIEFWADWPKKIYAQHQLFLVFLSFSYEGGKNNFSFFKKFFRGSRKATNSILLNQFENLNKTFPTIIEFFESKKVHAKVLPKLDSVNRKSACNWIGNYEDQISKFCNDTYALERQVKALYENRNAIPMEELARELKTIINS